MSDNHIEIGTIVFLDRKLSFLCVSGSNLTLPFRSFRPFPFPLSYTIIGDTPLQVMIWHILWLHSPHPTPNLYNLIYEMSLVLTILKKDNVTFNLHCTLTPPPPKKKKKKKKKDLKKDVFNIGIDYNEKCRIHLFILTILLLQIILPI